MRNTLRAHPSYAVRLSQGTMARKRSCAGPQRRCSKRRLRWRGQAKLRMKAATPPCSSRQPRGALRPHDHTCTNAWPDDSTSRKADLSRSPAVERACAAQWLTAPAPRSPATCRCTLHRCVNTVTLRPRSIVRIGAVSGAWRPCAAYAPGIRLSCSLHVRGPCTPQAQIATTRHVAQH
jgi:hypothetical protein